jgi:tetrahydromethanopterin S-methyltransferase subunit G
VLTSETSTLQHILAKALDEILQRIARKIVYGKKLSYQEIAILYLILIEETMEAGFNRINMRFEQLNRKFERADGRYKLIDRGFKEVNKGIDGI